jgi:hypothetical protein
MVVNIQNSGVEANLDAVFEGYGFFLNVDCDLLLDRSPIAAVLEESFERLLFGLLVRRCHQQGWLCFCRHTDGIVVQPGCHLLY